eukprot:3408649-Amphidinium_carterae.1
MATCKSCQQQRQTVLKNRIRGKKTQKGQSLKFTNTDGWIRRKIKSDSALEVPATVAAIRTGCCASGGCETSQMPRAAGTTEEREYKLSGSMLATHLAVLWLLHT